MSPLLLQFRIGNTYKRLSHRRPPKIHDWILYCDVVSGDPDLIHHVTFDLKDNSFSPRILTVHSPVRKDEYWRFSIKKTTADVDINAEIIVRGRGGSCRSTRYRIILSGDGSSLPWQDFIETRPHKPLKPLKLPPDTNFGIELEMTCASRDSTNSISSTIYDRSQIDVRVFNNYSRAKKHKGWKIMPDSSLVCAPHQPDCRRFELVSRVLTGGEGLNEAYKVLAGLENVASVTVNKSAGFHVHVDVRRRNLTSLKKICQTFCKYEEVMDTFMPPSRRTSIPENQYCKSNKLAVLEDGNDDTTRLAIIDNASSLDELCQIMNPGDDRYYKLNLCNLRTGRQSTIEFRQHSATTNYDKVNYWVRFCVALVTNGATMRSPRAFREGTTVEDKFEILFERVIKDRCLRDFYKGRRDVFARSSGQDWVHRGGGRCCSGCEEDGDCSAKIARHSLVGFFSF